MNNLSEMLPVEQKDGKSAVSARMLHEYLEVKKDFSDWIKVQIERCDLQKDVDYQSFPFKVEREVGATIRTEYALTLDAAKEVSMMSQCEKGKIARKYFIECERKLASQSKPMSPAELLLHQAQLLFEQEKRIAKVEDKVNLIEARTATRPDEFTVVGYATLMGLKINIAEASAMGRKASKLCKERGYSVGHIADPRFGQVNTYPRDVLIDVFEEPLN